MIPTKYQSEALEQIAEEKKYSNATIVQMASGLGKTFLAAFESLNWKGKVLFVCHRNEILQQACEIFSQITDKEKLGFLNQERKDCQSEVLFASIQTLCLKKNLEKFSPNNFDIIIIDECHHSLAKSYIKVISYFKPKFLLGMTATPYRTDDPTGDKLQEIFSRISYTYELSKAIDNGELTPFKLIYCKDNVDYSKIRWNGYKYNEKDLNKALLIKERDDAILKEYKKHLIDRRTIGFCVSVKHVERMVDLFKENGIKTEGITHKTNNEDRKRIHDLFKNGDIKIIFTRDIYNEGVDIPSVDGVFLLRPTTSKIVFFQQIGRGLRKQIYKKNVIIADFVGNYRNAYEHHEWLSISKNFGDGSGISRNIKPTYIYPNGCEVIFNEEIINMLEELKRNEERFESLTKETLYNLYVTQKLGVNEIAEKLVVSIRVVYKYLKKYGIKTKDRAFNLNKDELYDLHKEQKLTITDIAKKLGVSQATVINYFRKFGIETNKAINLNKDELYDLYVTQKLDAPKIAKKLGVTPTTVYDYLHKAGIEVKKRYNNLNNNYNKDELYDLYVTQKLSTPKIAKKLGVSQMTIYKHLKRYGIETRSVGRR